MNRSLSAKFLIVFSFLYSAYLFAGQGNVPSQTSTQSGYNQTKSHEQGLKELLAELKKDGFSTQDFYDKIITPLQSPSQSPSQSKDVLPLDQDYLSKWEERNSDLHRQRYLWTIQKQHYFIVLFQNTLHQLVIDLQKDPALSSKEKAKMNAKFKKILETFQDWADASDVLGEGVDPKKQRDRMYALSDYFKEVRELLLDLNKAPALKSIWNASNGQFAKGLAVTGATGTYLALQIVTRFFNHVNPLYLFVPKSWRKEVNKTLFKNYTPLTTKGGITTLFRAVTDMKGYKVSVEGKEYLKTIPLEGIPDKKVVNLFLPSHRSETVDAMAMSHLDLPHFLIFANPGAFAPDFVTGSMLASLAEFISVGKWKGFPSLEPATKLIEALEEKRSPNVINYPQGFVSNVGEILPINANFVKKLLKPLLDAGYEVNLIPISYEVDSKFLSRSGSVDDLEVTVKIHQPLLHKSVQILVESQLAAMKKGEDSMNGRYIDHFIATLWYENITLQPELSLDQLMKRAEDSLGVRFDPEWVTVAP